jgi:hypothetical protein
MPALVATPYSADIIWLGIVENRAAALLSGSARSLALGFDGPEGESHGGMTRPSCSRVKHLYPRGTPIRNTRQVSIVSSEDLCAIAAQMGLDSLDPRLLGANMVLRGLPDLSHLPPSSRLLAGSGACLVIDMENRPCTLPAKQIETTHPGKGATFKRAAAGRRGVTAWIEAEGRVAIGDSLRLFVPDQPRWAGELR